MLFGDQVAIRCIFLRGGTSRGLYFKAHDLPADPAVRDGLLLAAFGSPDARQINGIGGGDSHTSKVMIIARSTRPDCDVDYTFGQIGVTVPRVDWKGNCGNLTAAVGMYAVDEGLVPVVEPVTQVRAFNTNTQKRIFIDVPISGRHAAVLGACAIDGVPGTGARYLVDFRESVGAGTGTLLPTGHARDTVRWDGREVEVSVVDVANLTVFVRARDVGLRGAELAAQLNADQGLLDRLETLRGLLAERLGIVPDWRRAAELSPVVPFLCLVSSPADYLAADGRPIAAADVDVVSRPLSSQKAHKSHQATVAVCVSVAARLPGTLVHEVARPDDGTGRVRIGHSAGTLGLAVSLAQHPDGYTVERAALERTCRRLMDGFVYVPKTVLEP